MHARAISVRFLTEYSLSDTMVIFGVLRCGAFLLQHYSSGTESSTSSRLLAFQARRRCKMCTGSSPTRGKPFLLVIFRSQNPLLELVSEDWVCLGISDLFQCVTKIAESPDQLVVRAIHQSRILCGLGLSRLDGGASPIYGEFCAVNEAGTVCGQEDNCFGDFISCCRTTRRRLSS